MIKPLHMHIYKYIWLKKKKRKSKLKFESRNFRNETNEEMKPLTIKHVLINVTDKSKFNLWCKI